MHRVSSSQGFRVQYLSGPRSLDQLNYVMLPTYSGLWIAFLRFNSEKKIVQIPIPFRAASTSINIPMKALQLRIPCDLCNAQHVINSTTLLIIGREDPNLKDWIVRAHGDLLKNTISSIPKILHLWMYGQMILSGISKASFEIPQVISGSQIERCVYFIDMKFKSS